jgi:hypothetical protein
MSAITQASLHILRMSLLDGTFENTTNLGRSRGWNKFPFNLMFASFFFSYRKQWNVEWVPRSRNVHMQ